MGDFTCACRQPCLRQYRRYRCGTVPVGQSGAERIFVNGLKADKRMEMDDVGMMIWRVVEVGRMKRRGSSYRYYRTKVPMLQAFAVTNQQTSEFFPCGDDVENSEVSADRNVSAGSTARRGCTFW